MLGWRLPACGYPGATTFPISNTNPPTHLGDNDQHVPQGRVGGLVVARLAHHGRHTHDGRAHHHTQLQAAAKREGATVRGARDKATLARPASVIDLHSTVADTACTVRMKDTKQQQPRVHVMQTTQGRGRRGGGGAGCRLGDTQTHHAEEVLALQLAAQEQVGGNAREHYHGPPQHLEVAGVGLQG